jgi:DNA repair photolyase
MHYTKAKGILSAKNSMNIYRGCTHGCIYCDSRSKVYQINHKFEDIEIKENAIELLENRLISKRKKCMISTGSMTDSYMPLEKDIEMTKKALEVIYKYGFGVSILTKSSLILRDLDLLKKINERSKAVVQLTLTTYDEELCKILEPNVSTTKERFDVLMKFKEHNVPTVVWLGPFLPFINDNLDNLKGILDYCIKAKVKGILNFGIGLTLREGNREYFYEKLDIHFPGLKEKYIKTYGNNYVIGSKNHKEMMNYFTKVCKENDILYKPNDVFQYLDEFPSNSEQLSLFDV